MLGGGLPSVTDVDRADTDVGTYVATGLRAWSLTSVTNVDRASCDVGTDVAGSHRPQWCRTIIVTDVIPAVTDAGTNTGADWPAEHR